MSNRAPAIDPSTATIVAQARASALHGTLALRTGLAMAFLVLLLVMNRGSNGPDAGTVGPVALLTMLAGLGWWQRRRWPERALAIGGALVDVALVTTALFARLASSLNPERTAAFGVGILAVVLTLSALTLRRSALIASTTACLVAAAALQNQSGLPLTMQALGLLILLAVGTSVSILSVRMQRMLDRLTDTHRHHLAQLRQAAQAEEARAATQKELDESLAREARLTQLQRDKDALTQLMVHDLRAPLTVANGHVQLVRSYLERAQTSGGPWRAVNDTLATLQRVTAMIGDILQVARLEEGRLELHRQRLEPALFWRQVERSTKGLLGERPVVLQAVWSGDGTLEADEKLLRRLLDNLVSNAVRYTPDNQRLRLLLLLGAEETIIAVQNDGPTIAPDMREPLFEKYRQDRPDRDGWGLGLYFCRLAAEAHGGRIAVEDRDDFATSFVVRLPAPRDAA